MSNVKVYSKLRDLIKKISIWVSGFLLVFMLLIIVFQVAFRNILGVPLPWAEALSVYMMIALGLYGSVFVLHEKGHLCVDSLVQRFPHKLQLGVKAFVLIIQAIFTGGLAWFAIGSLLSASKVAAVSLGVSMLFPYLSIPVAFFLIFLETIFQVIDNVRGIIYNHNEVDL